MGPDVEKVVYPVQSVISNAVEAKFVKKSFERDLVKCFGKVHHYDISLKVSIKGLREFMCKGDELGFTRSGGAKAMLQVIENGV
jgi:hypothetical protein